MINHVNKDGSAIITVDLLRYKDMLDTVDAIADELKEKGTDVKLATKLFMNRIIQTAGKELQSIGVEYAVANEVGELLRDYDWFDEES